MKVGIDGKGFGWIDPVPYKEEVDVQGGEITFHINPYANCTLSKVAYNDNDVTETVKGNKGVLHLTNVGDKDVLSVAFGSEDGVNLCKLDIACEGGGGSYPASAVDCAISSSPKFYIKADDGMIIKTVSLIMEKEEPVDITDAVKANGGVYTIENISKGAAIKAQFDKPQMFTIECDCGENGTCEPQGVMEVAEDDDFSCTVVADKGYEIDKVLVDDVNVTGKLVDGCYKFENVSANHKLYATFKKVAPMPENEVKAMQYRQIVTNAYSAFNEANDAILRGDNDKVRVCSLRIERMTSQLLDFFRNNNMI